MIRLLRPLLAPAVRRALRSRFSSPEIHGVFDDAFKDYEQQRPRLSKEKELGARLMVHFAALTAGFYRALLARRVPDEEARRLTAEVTWHVYDKMAAVPWALARATERTPYDRLRRATELFRRFPFRAPSYDMVDVGAAADVVAFDVRRCPVAEYFQAQGLRRSASTRGATSTCRWRRSGVRGSSARARSRRGQSSATSAGTSRGGSKPCCPRPARGDPAAAAARALDADPDKLQRDTFGYFVHETIAANGLVIDKTAEDWPASIAATGLALAAYPVGVERGFLSRSAAVERTLATLRFFWNSRQDPEPDATGYHGFYYHFLDMRTGHRVWR